MIKWQLKNFESLTNTELYNILKLRSQIFVIEQNCIFQDLDDKDQKAFHLFTQNNDEVLAYTRLFAPGACYQEASIGRVMVNEKARGTGLGFELMRESIKQIQNQFGKTPIKIGAQLYLKIFYENLGFKQISDTYLEDDIPHIYMLKP
ncbi:MAG: GNAT family N-acetyltransferase [Flavobacteriales bacterium CG03_land_8_20_14_0_80_35_15]|nr:MAG: GNAT family N-acetyltransferase [Flavobacteriales bacterium CG11_big_fil_rev_8_21_14_0_20_35_7]PIV17573.1 MAG: GNAT family N-acetyltransferase [Flavobacteriales bacterium CG03_land_8_20_14_0_80_35_15]PIX07296.1 MAG: GNAT family N-acetyltransferase [Flavobacteriales bacterium CG_4_8_14_3_um_filter_35_10]PJA04797.1 MAG: GNAT family N-acetyltransferase [Flavobacteriales bacterium CG_4_10_14_0_2_um_filter_35_18]